MLLMLMDIEYDISILILGFLIFSNLFTKEFLNTKKHTPLLDKILTFIIFFYILDTILKSYISDIFPSSIFLIFYIFTAIVVYKKTKSKPILFYIVGWSIVILSFIFIDFQFFFAEILGTDIPLDILIHIIAPLESLILAFTLSYKMKLLEEEKLQAERITIHQNKLASMGEMISNIAHQWRQPLTHLSYIIMNINTAHKHKKLDDIYLKNKSDEATDQLEYMSQTIDDFRNFYSPQKEKTQFSTKQEIQKAINIVSSSLKAKNITIEVLGSDINYHGYSTEFSQVILNLITNAKDALIQNNTKEPKIIITIKKDLISICDNAGGIDNKIKEKIFEPYFTTKSKGTGIGLYMSKTIIEKHFNAQLTQKNQNNGSCFDIKLNID
jgi:signal transduction histidine kinase